MADERKYPQPWLLDDGGRVRGQQLTGDLAAILSLEDETMPARHALTMVSFGLRQWDIETPIPVGALVVEVSRGRIQANYRVGDWHRVIGVVILKRTEWAETDNEWAAIVAEHPSLSFERAADYVTYIQYGPAPEDVCRWTNGKFVLLPWQGRT